MYNYLKWIFIGSFSKNIPFSHEFTAAVPFLSRTDFLYEFTSMVDHYLSIETASECASDCNFAIYYFLQVLCFA